LVEELAEEWGVEMTAAGKAVWFEVNLAVNERLLWGRGRPEHDADRPRVRPPSRTPVHGPGTLDVNVARNT
jgi:hypothetical protein